MKPFKKIQYKKVIDTVRFFKPTTIYEYTGELWKISISPPFISKGWSYEITSPELDKDMPRQKVIACDRDIQKKHQHDLKTLKGTKTVCEKIIQLLDKANTPGGIWILKGVMLGFINEEDMLHLKSLN